MFTQEFTTPEYNIEYEVVSAYVTFVSHFTPALLNIY